MIQGKKTFQRHIDKAISFMLMEGIICSKLLSHKKVIGRSKSFLIQTQFVENVLLVLDCFPFCVERLNEHYKPLLI